MKQVPKGLAMLSCSVDKTLAGGILAVALIGGAPLTAHSTDIMGGVKSPTTQQVSQKQQVSGTVIDETGEAMLGVSVIEVGTKTGVATDLDGNFTLNVPQGAKLQFSYIGYKTQTITATGQSHIEVKMEPDNNVLDDVVVVGYGTVKKRDLTGAVSSVKSDVITLTPTANPMDALQGRVAGLDISRTSGAPGAGVDIQLRGNRSFNASGNPLFIIDGMPGDYSTINPNDIESIEVLKDASSTAVYGSSGANGVIIITTKKGEAGTTRVNFDAYYGYNGWSKLPTMNNAQQWADTKIYALEQAGLPTDNNPDINAAIQAAAEGRTIDWVDTMLKGGSSQNYSLSVSGGTEKTQAYFSLNYNRTDGQYENDNYDVYSSSIRLNQKVASWLDAGVHSQLSYTNLNRASINLQDALQADPFGELYNEDGSIKVYPLDVQTDKLNLLLNNQPGVYKDNRKRIRLYVQPYIRIYPIKGMTFESRLSANFSYNKDNMFRGYGSYQFYQQAGAAAVGNEKDPANAKYTYAKISNSDTFSYQWENILTYNFKIANDHEFTLTGVTTWSDSNNNSSDASNAGFSSNTYYWTNLGQPGNTLAQVASDYTMSKGMGYVGRLNYSYLGKYLFSASVRHDGKSVLAKDVRWDTFPSVSAGWRFSEEKFMDWSRNWLNNAKLRVGYGVTGAAGINPYSSMTNLINNAAGLGDEKLNAYYYPQVLSNATLTWEKSKSWNFGLDASALNYRIDMSLDYFLTNTDDVIWTQSLPIVNGGDVISGKPFTMNTNIAETRNHGIELTLNTKNIVTRDFTWSSTLTLTRNWEKVKSLGAGASDYVTHGDYTLHVGDPIKSFYGYALDGIWQYGQEADAAVFGKAPGDLRVSIPNMRKVSDGVWEKVYPDQLDDNGNPITRTFDKDNPYAVSDTDRQIIGHASPDWTIGFNNTFTYKWFDLSVYMYYRGGQMIKYNMMTQYDSKGGAFPAYFDYWTKDNPSNDFPALDANRDWRNDTYHSSLAYQEGSFFKIKNITLGYTLPKVACNKMRIQNLRLYGTLTNPLVHATNKMLKDYDPEMNGQLNNPLTKQLVFGLSLTL